MIPKILAFLAGLVFVGVVIALIYEFREDDDLF